MSKRINEASLFFWASGEFPDVAKSMGETRPFGAVKHKAATETELTESSGEFPDVVKSGGMGGAWSPGFAKYIASVSESEPAELIITAKKAFISHCGVSFE